MKVNTEVCAKLKDRAAAHTAIKYNPEVTAEDKNKKSHYDLRTVIKRAKGQYRNKKESYYQLCRPHRMWQDLQSITDYKGRPSHDMPNVSSTRRTRCI